MQTKPASSPSPAHPMPLDGVRVLDLATEQGLMCGRLLADLGADVIKVEPPGGDPARALGPFYKDIPGSDRSLAWQFLNLNKRGVTIDSESPAGAAFLRRLVKTADILVESFPPGRMARLGLDYPALSKLNPRLIMVSVSPFGQTGPSRDWKAADIVEMAMGGWMSPSGDADRPPVRCSVEQAYLQAGAQAAAAVMIAYCQREQTGAGSYIDLSIHEAVLNSVTGVVSMYQHDKSVQKRTALATFNHLVRRPSFKCKDGYIAFRYYTGRGMGSQMKNVIEWMKEEGKAQELATFDFEQRKLTETTQAESDRWDQVFAEFFINYTKKEIYQQALKRRFMMFPVNTMADILRDDQLAARRFFVTMPAPSLGGDLLFPGAFVHMSETPVAFRRLAPKVGEHNDEILGKELGLSPQEIDGMSKSHAG